MKQFICLNQNIVGLILYIYIYTHTHTIFNPIITPVLFTCRITGIYIDTRTFTKKIKKALFTSIGNEISLPNFAVLL